MKKTLLLIGCLIITNFLSAQVSTTSLVAYWPFNGNANDLSGNNHNGTNNGATLTTDRFGNPNTAYNFNGSAYIDVPYSSQFAFGTNTDITISAWVKTSGVYNFFRFYLAYACSNSSAGTGGFQLGVDDNTMPLYCEFGASYSGNANMSNNLWHNLIVIFNRTIDSVKFYNNGAFLAQVYINNAVNYSPTCNPSMLIGGERNFDNIHYWIGDIDDMRIYNRAITPQEVGVLNAEGTTGVNESAVNNNMISIYPNPSNGIITIKKTDLNENFKIRITNSLGQELLKNSMTENQVVIDLSGFNSGIYFVQISDEQGQTLSVKKIILK